MIIARLYLENSPDQRSLNFKIISFIKKSPIPFKFHGRDEESYESINMEEIDSFFIGKSENLSFQHLFKSSNDLITWMVFSKPSIGTQIVFYIDDSFFKKSSSNFLMPKQLEMIYSACAEFDVYFASIDSENVYRNQHELRTEIRPGVTKREQLGLNISNFIPGIYWINIFRIDLATKLAVNRKIDSSYLYMYDKDNYKALILRCGLNPFDQDKSIRYHVLKELGSENFFSLNK